MQKKLDIHQCRKCLACTRKGKRCQSPAMLNGRCRMHGGLSTGAPKGNRNAYKHGRYSAEASTERRMIREMIKQANQLIEEVE